MHAEMNETLCDQPAGLLAARPMRGIRPRLEVVRTSDELSSVVLVEAPGSPADATISALREQLALLAGRYAEELTSLEARLRAARAEAEQAWDMAHAARARAQDSGARVAELTAALTRAEGEAAAHAAHAARLEAAARLPWWAFKRRRAAAGDADT